MRQIKTYEGKSNLNVLGLIVVYDEHRSPTAIARFQEFIFSNYSECHVRVISNNSKIEANINGSNLCGEFSGWEEGLSQDDVDKYQVIIFANDTFSSSKRFSQNAEEKFTKKIAEAHRRSVNFIVGEVCWHIDYQLATKLQCFLIKWVRTDIFAISVDALKLIHEVSLSTEKIDSLVKKDKNGNYVLNQALPRVVRKRIDSWLRPEAPYLGWHGAPVASKTILRLKAKCVLQEILLTRRCVEADVKIYNHKSKEYLREFALRSIFYFQNKFYEYR